MSIRIKYIVTGLVVALVQCVMAQQGFKAYEDTLLQLEKNLYSVKTDKAKQEINTKFKTVFERALNICTSFEYPFDSLKEIGRIYSPDKSFRIINWDIPKEDGTYNHCGFIQTYDARRKTCRLYALIDKSDDIKNPDNTVGDANKWIGMLYYKIIPVKVKRKKYYTLLAKDGNDKLTGKKIIDVLYFVSDGSPRFGVDLFKLEKRSPKRVIFEYSAQTAMSLKYFEETKRIVFDHLSPSQPGFEGQHQYYGPDFSFDALEFKKGKWVYVADVDARNGKSTKDNKYNDPKDKSREYDNEKLYEPKK
ncbi:MAG: hypothetical protein HYU69_05345 [Bacteroidetes bacterium]|nr:hypothetical protein [Bacteroidota bacterium]